MIVILLFNEILKFWRNYIYIESLINSFNWVSFGVSRLLSFFETKL